MLRMHQKSHQFTGLRIPDSYAAMEEADGDQHLVG